MCVFYVLKSRIFRILAIFGLIWRLNIINSSLLYLDKVLKYKKPRKKELCYMIFRKKIVKNNVLFFVHLALLLYAILATKYPQSTPFTTHIIDF